MGSAKDGKEGKERKSNGWDVDRGEKRNKCRESNP